MRGILINEQNHTGKDWGLVMTSKSLSPPEPQTYMVEVPGRNGLLDLSEALTGEPRYRNRELKFTFFGNGSRDEVKELIAKMNELHGKEIEITDDDSTGWYYIGRVKVEHVDRFYWVEFTLTVDAQPFRYAREAKNYAVTNVTAKKVTVINEGVTVIPTIVTTAQATISFNGATYSLDAGTYESEKIRLAPGDNEFVITSTGGVTITFSEAVI